MNITREEKKVEAIARMKLLGLFPETIKQFEREDLVSLSEPPFGAFYWLDDLAKAEVKAFEESYNALVYVGVRAQTVFGKMDAYLYVSDHKDEWPADREDLQVGQPYAYVVNLDDHDLSEIGSIGIERTVAAGLRRVW